MFDYHACRACAAPSKRDERAQLNIGTIDPTYLRSVLEGNQIATQCCSLLDVGLHVQEKAQCFARGNLHTSSLLHHPLVTSTDLVQGLSSVLQTLPQHMHSDAAAAPRAYSSEATISDGSGSSTDTSDDSDMDDAARVQQVLCANLLTNPLVQNYVTVAERTDTHITATALDRSICDTLEAAERNRGPLAKQQARSLVSSVGVLVDQRPAAVQRHACYVHAGLLPRSIADHDADSTDDDEAYTDCESEGDSEEAEEWSDASDALPDTSDVYASDDDSAYSEDGDTTTSAAAAPARPVPLTTRADGTPISGDSKRGISLEAGLFPMLFTHGRGWYRWARRSCLANYLRMRACMVFYMFTLYLPFLLYMFVVRQQHLLAACLVDQVLQRDVARQRRRNPDATNSEVVANLLRQRVPATLVNSPAYFRNSLADLQCMVNALGMPHLFLTLTEDEVSETRWRELKDLDERLNRYA